jgi:hypothetical protein
VLFRLVAILSVFILGLSQPADARPLTIKFAPTTLEILNPERGYSSHLIFNDSDAVPGWMSAAVNRGHTIGLTMIRLDDYRDKPLPPSFLATLEKNFALARKFNLKLIIRFAYNYPTSSSDYATARDAPLSIVLGHIKQLGPVITANRDTIISMQVGFVGLWGEGHSSNNDLTSPESREAIRKAIYAAVPKDLPIQHRYPGWIVSLTGDTRMGFHNDCFLSSTDDVGTYSGSAADKAKQRTAMAERTKTTYFSAETCQQNNPTGARKNCAGFLAEGPLYHLSAITGLGFSEGREKCEPDIKRKLGYRLELGTATISSRGTVTLSVKNVGWARAVQKRPIIVSAYLGKVLKGQAVLKGTLDSVAPAGKSVSFTGYLPSAPRADRICFSAPDGSARLAKNAAYSIRFANADSATQAWDPKLAAFCVKVAKRR